MPTRKGKAAKDDDPQCKAIYAWEECWREWNVSTLSLRACRDIIWAVCAAQKIEPPTVVQHRKASFSYCDTNNDIISLQAEGAVKLGGFKAGGKNLAQVLHEVAHYIVHKKFKHYRDHGPTFMAIYLSLLERYKVAPPIALRASARAMGIKWRKNW